MANNNQNLVHITQDNDTLMISARVSIQQAKAWLNGTAIAIGSGIIWLLSHAPLTPPPIDHPPVLPADKTEQIDRH
jgi:hypothetical protein